LGLTFYIFLGLELAEERMKGLDCLLVLGCDLGPGAVLGLLERCLLIKLYALDATNWAASTSLSATAANTTVTPFLSSTVEMVTCFFAALSSATKSQ
jgi:hypothetical protein